MGMRLLASTAKPTNNSRRLTALGQTALPAATAEEHGEGALNTSTKALPRFEGRALVGWALGSLIPPALWEADLLDFFWLAVLNILLTMEAPIGTVEVGSAAEYLRMTIQRSLNLVFIAGLSIQDFLICNPARSTFGQKDLGPELDRGEYLATLDHIGVGSKIE
jgi:hypothetical protein